MKKRQTQSSGLTKEKTMDKYSQSLMVLYFGEFILNNEITRDEAFNSISELISKFQNQEKLTRKIEGANHE